jgi:hypothetical protein
MTIHEWFDSVPEGARQDSLRPGDCRNLAQRPKPDLAWALTVLLRGGFGLWRIRRQFR